MSEQRADRGVETVDVMPGGWTNSAEISSLMEIVPTAITSRELDPTRTSEPMSVYEEGLTTGDARLQAEDGSTWELPIPIWSGEVDRADQQLLRRCQGPTLDVGCGPGRITAALSRRGLPALGVDVSALAVAMTRSRGGLAVRRDIFSLTLGERRWSHVLLADGNVGIGGDPVRLLWRCRDLVGAGGSVLLDLEPPGTGLRSSRVQLRHGGRASDWFPWAWLGVDAVATVAEAAGLAVRDVWCADPLTPRWQAELVPAEDWPAQTEPQPN